ncbi:MAG: hypothetical protein K0Q71_1135 [Thermomicrobiales bacterium]|nr:hypothetical protein [Thermomicrobiales bacterium]
MLAYEGALAALAQVSLATIRELEVGLHERLGRTHLLVGHLEAADAAFARMLEAAQATGDRAGEGRALVWSSYVRRRLYQPGASETAGEAALRVASELGEPRLLGLAHWNLGHLHEVGGHLEKSLHHAVEAERMARAGAEPYILSRSLDVQSLLAVWRGDYPEGERLAREALALARETEAPVRRGEHQSIACLALGEQGQYMEAHRVLLAGVALAESLGERYYLSKLLNNVGWLYHELGDPHAARAWHARLGGRP